MLGTVGEVSFNVTMPSTPTTIYVSGNTSSANYYYPTLVTNNKTLTDEVTGDTSAYMSSKLYYVPSTGVLTSTTFNTTSDARLKENITEYKCDNSILDLPVYKYDFIDGAKNQIGCLAQDLQKICPELVTEGDKSYLTIAESKIVYLLLQELKTQSERIGKLEKALAEMEK